MTSHRLACFMDRSVNRKDTIAYGYYIFRRLTAQLAFERGGQLRQSSAGHEVRMMRHTHTFNPAEWTFDTPTFRQFVLSTRIYERKIRSTLIIRSGYSYASLAPIVPMPKTLLEQTNKPLCKFDAMPTSARLFGLRSLRSSPSSVVGIVCTRLSIVVSGATYAASRWRRSG